MDANTIRWLVTGAFALHGVGMAGAAGYLPWSIRDPKASFIGASWILGAGGLSITIGVIVWLIAGVGFIGAAVGFWQGAAWWRLWAWVGSVFTLLAVGLWFGSVPFGVYVGAALAVGTIGYLVFE